jgi:hypothetical protein
MPLSPPSLLFVLFFVHFPFVFFAKILQFFILLIVQFVAPNSKNCSERSIKWLILFTIFFLVILFFRIN